MIYQSILTFLNVRFFHALGSVVNFRVLMPNLQDLGRGPATDIFEASVEVLDALEHDFISQEIF